MDQQRRSYFTLPRRSPNGLYRIHHDGDDTRIELLFRMDTTVAAEIPAFDTKTLYQTWHKEIRRYPLPDAPVPHPKGEPRIKVKGEPWFEALDQDLSFYESALLSPTRIVANLRWSVNASREEKLRRTLLLDRDKGLFYLLPLRGGVPMCPKHADDELVIFETESSSLDEVVVDWARFEQSSTVTTSDPSSPTSLKPAANQ
jgi:hypothetical protein